MIQLRTLGGLELQGPPGRDYASVLAQSKRLTLLAYLALAHRGDFARRDSIIGLFWPTLDGDHARSALRQSLTFLRRALGDDLFERRGAEDIGVRTTALEIDVARFDSACDAGDLDQVAGLYRGDFLQGVFVSDVAPELERWIEDERARLLRRAVRAARDLSERSERSGNLALAVEHARRAVTLMPYDEHGLRHFMTLLGRASDAGSAVRAYETFAQRLAADLEEAPDATTTALAGQLRAGAAGIAIHALPAVDQSDRAGFDSPHIPQLPGESAHVGTTPVAPATRPPSRRHRALSGAAVVTLGIAIIATVLTRSRESEAVHVAPERLAISTRNEAARELYVKARFVLQQETIVGLQTAAGYLVEAVEADSGFAQAWAALAVTYAHMPPFGGVAPNDAYPRAQAAAMRALELDPTAAEATLALAHVSAYYHWDWVEGDRLFRRASELAPSDATVQTNYGDFLSSCGRLRESIAHFERAKVLDPSSRRAPNNLARRLIWNREYDRALAELTTALTLEPRFARAHRTLGILYSRLGRYPDAITELSKAGELSGGRPFDLSPLAEAYILAGKPAEAVRIVEGLEARARREYVPPYAIATIYASLGQRDKAFTWLDRAVDAHDATLSLTVLYETMLDPVRGDPRFATVLERMRLPAPRGPGSREPSPAGARPD